MLKFICFFPSPSSWEFPHFFLLLRALSLHITHTRRSSLGSSPSWRLEKISGRSIVGDQINLKLYNISFLWFLWVFLYNCSKCFSYYFTLIKHREITEEFYLAVWFIFWEYWLLKDNIIYELHIHLVKNRRPEYGENRRRCLSWLTLLKI